MKRLYKNKEPGVTVLEVSAPATPCSLQERLKMSVGSVNAGPLQAQEIGDPFKKEFDSYDRHRVRGPLLNQFFDDLCSVQPTSTQSERNFSLAAGIATKKRARMSSEKLNACCFLKSYFMKKN